MPLEDCLRATPAAQQRIGEQTSEEETRHRERLHRERRHVIALAAGGLLIAAIAVGLVLSHGATTRRLAIARPVSTEPPLANPPPDSPHRLDAAFVVASRALACEDWTSALPFVRRANRIEPLMERYHREHPWNHVALTRRHNAELIDRQGVTFARIEAEGARGRRVHLELEETPDGWKLDWEALVNAPRFEWREFYSQRPEDPRRLRVTALKASVPDAYCLTAKCEPTATLAVRLWGTEPGDSVVALVPNDSDLARTLASEISWDIAQRYVAELRLADPKAVPPRVNLIAILQKDWLLRD